MTHVVPAGVRHNPDAAKADRLSVTLHEATENLRLLATMSPEEAAVHLLEHSRSIMAPDLCRHDLPIFHPAPDRGRDPCTSPSAPGTRAPGLRVAGVVAMANALDAVHEIVERIGRRHRIPAHLVNDALAWPIVTHPALQRMMLAEINQGERTLQLPRARQLVQIFLKDGFAQSLSSVELVWLSQRRPEFALSTHGAVGLYLADVARHLGLVSEDRTYLCSVCSQPFTPKRAPKQGDALYCRAPECQRHRQRRNKAASRARTTSSGEAGEI